MRRWPSEKHFASWLTLAPGTQVSGGKTLSGRTKPSASRAAAALRLAARSLHHSKSALGAFFRRLKTRLGAPKAITATAHKLARLIYRMLKCGHQAASADRRQPVLRHLAEGLEGEVHRGHGHPAPDGARRERAIAGPHRRGRRARRRQVDGDEAAHARASSPGSMMIRLGRRPPVAGALPEAPAHRLAHLALQLTT